MKHYLLLISLVSAMGGLLFGYDWVVIGGAKPFYEAFFGIAHSPSMQGWVMGSAILGCILGVIVAGGLADKYGRKPLMIVSAVIFIISAVGTGAVNTVSWFIFYRLVGGVAIGIASNLSPMYIAEISPRDKRGLYVSINQLTIVLGILAAQLANWLIADPVTQGESILSTWNGQMGWRWMFWAENVPALLFFIFLFFIPESPRWLAARGFTDRAQIILTRTYGEKCAREELALIIQGNRSSERSSFHENAKELLNGKVLHLVLIGVIIAAFQQWCGINVIFNYAQEVFAAAGYHVSDILLNIVITGVTNVVFTFVGMYTVDKLGRRSLMLLGSGMLALIYAVMGFCYYQSVSGLPLLLLVILAIAVYAMTLAPVTWVVISEIFPTRIRGLAMGISTFSLWLACFLLTYTFPIFNARMGASGTFWLYGGICILGFLFIRAKLPETKQKSLEEIEKEFTH